MSGETWKFKGYDASTGKDLSRYGFRKVLDEDEVRQRGQADMMTNWMLPLSWGMKNDVESTAENLYFQWVREYGDEVEVKVYENGTLKLTYPNGEMEGED